jgi:2-dehydropantoate 2-reductase
VKIAVVGAGAIGALVAGYLNQKGVTVTLIGKDKDVAAIGGHGLQIEGVRGSFVVPVKVTSRLEANNDLIILAVKTQDIVSTMKINAPALANAMVLTVQNGVRAEEIVTEFVPRDRIISSIVMFGATYLEQGKVVHNFEGDWILGKAFAPNDNALKSISELLANAFPAPVKDNISGMKWLKLFLNMNNCLPAVTGKSMQETFAEIEIAELSIRLWQEALRVVDKAGIELGSLPDFPVDRLRGLAAMPIAEASKIYSQIMTGLSKEPLYGSILQSIKRGRPSEIDYINGEIVRLGEGIAVPTPLNKMMVELVHRVENTGEFLEPRDILKGAGV